MASTGHQGVSVHAKDIVQYAYVLFSHIGRSPLTLGLIGWYWVG